MKKTRFHGVFNGRRKTFGRKGWKYAHGIRIKIKNQHQKIGGLCGKLERGIRRRDKKYQTFNAWTYGRHAHFKNKIVK